MFRSAPAFCLLTAFLGFDARAQPPQSFPPPQLAEHQPAEIKRLEAEIHALWRSAAAPAEWQEWLKIGAELAELQERQRTEQLPLQRKLEELSQSQAIRTWRDRIAQQERRLKQLRAADYEATKQSGRRLFEARHARLAGAGPAEAPQLRELALDVLSYPRMDGSTSTQPLATILACRCFGVPYGWVGREQAFPRRSSHDATSPTSESRRLLERLPYPPEPELELLEFTLRARAGEPKHERLAVIINSLLAANASTHQAYVNLIEGRSDIGLLARPPSPDESELAREKGVELEVTPCARDAFVFLVHETNPVTDLTTAQIQAIYSGRTRNWKDLGGPDQPIVAYQREENSGSQQLMRTHVMKDVPLEKPAGRYQHAPQLVGRLMSSPFLSLTSEENGIGYSVHYYEQFMSGSPRTRTLAVDGVVPTYESIYRQTYPYVTDVLVVTRKDAPQSSAVRLRDWLLTAEGQAVVRESGYVPVVQSRER